MNVSTKANVLGFHCELSRTAEMRFQNIIVGQLK